MASPTSGKGNSSATTGLSLRALLVLFTGGLLAIAITATSVVGFDRFRDYVTLQLRGHAQDGATAVGLSLSNAIDGRDPVAAASLIDALFDSGRYLSVRFETPSGEVVAAREAALDELAVPDWFVRLVELPRPTGTAAVVRGWNQLGTVQVASHPGPAYEDLWRAALDWLMGTFVVGALGLGVLAWLIRRSLQPLSDMEAQAEALANRDFSQRVRDGGTRELRQVTGALNRMADEMGHQFEGQARLIEHLRRLNNEDGLTGLATREAFDHRLMAEIESEERSGVGVLVLIQLAGFADYNLHHGRDEADAVLKRIGERLAQFTQEHAGAMAGRRSGAEFALYLPASRADSVIWVDTLIQDLELLYGGDRRQEALSVHAGLAEGEPGQAARALWAAADEALRQAQAIGGSGYHIANPARTDHRNSRDWRALIASAIESQRLTLFSQPMIDARSGSPMFGQVTTRLQADWGGIKAGIYVPMAERFGLVVDLDRWVLARALAHLAESPNQNLNLTLGEGSVASADFRQSLIERLESAGEERRRLLLSLPEQSLHRQWGEVAALVRSLASLSVPVIVDRFGVGGVPFSYLRNLSFQAVRIDHSFVRNVDRHTENRFFIESVVGIAHSAGKQVFASGVETGAEEEALIAAGVDGLMGFHLGRPAAVAAGQAASD